MTVINLINTLQDEEQISIYKNEIMCFDGYVQAFKCNLDKCLYLNQKVKNIIIKCFANKQIILGFRIDI